MTINFSRPSTLWILWAYGNSGASPTKMIVTLDSVGTSVEFVACLILPVDGSKISRFRWGSQVAATLEKDLEDERRERR